MERITRPDVSAADAAAVEAWAASGAMALTGHAGRPPLGPPRPLVPRLRDVASRLERASAAIGRTVEVDPIALLGERAAIAGLARRGRTSCGGSTRLLAAADGWVAVALARPEDVELVPAWLGVAADPDPEATWASVAAAVGSRERSDVVERAALLGLPVAALPAERSDEPPAPVAARTVADAPPTTDLTGLVVVDLGALWAGPLCGSLLALAGATVVKVESTNRPDGARDGPPRFFDLLNAGKRSVAVDLTGPGGPGALRRVLARAHVVIEASRPRALAQLGIDADELLTAGRTRVWVSITAHGRTGPGANRVGFGDDAAVAGGLVCRDEDGPVFCADAVADPTTGLVAATATLEALAGGGRHLLDVAMSRVAARLAGPTLPAPATIRVAAPRARPVPGRAPALGGDDGVVEELLERRGRPA